MATAKDFDALELAIDAHAGDRVAISGARQCAKRSKYFHALTYSRIKSDPPTLKQRHGRSVGLRPAPDCGCLDTEAENA